ncbi:MAG TPA: hypothetical protein VL068_15290 [Microthrixaceae bacterium]|nr:hypothetical protein [Microthrixaceae bacterium]
MSVSPLKSGEMPSPAELLEIVDSFPAPSAVGIEPAGEHLNLHVKQLVPDGRAGASGLFGFRAPESWQAIGLSVAGVAVPLDDANCQLDRTGKFGRHPFETDDVDELDELDEIYNTPHETDDRDASYSLLLTRSGEFAAKLWHREEENVGCWPSADCDPGIPQGVSVDALHRVLGLPSPGTEPPTTHLVISLWLDEVMSSLLHLDQVTWMDAAQLHLKDVGNPARVDPSVETIVESIMRASSSANWERLRTRGAKRSRSTATLRPHELEWMDSTMYGRWVMSFLPDHDMVVDALIASGSEDAGTRIAGVIKAVNARCPNLYAPLQQRRSA